MTIHHRLFRVSIVLSLLAVLPIVGRSNAPLAPPYSRFSVSGTVERTDSGTVENLPVVLTELNDDFENGFEILRGLDGGSRDVALTLADGSFYISVKAAKYPIDSIAVAVVLPWNEFHFGEPIAVANLKFGTHTSWMTVESNGYCSSDDKVEHTDGYLYSIIDQTVTFP